MILANMDGGLETWDKDGKAAHWGWQLSLIPSRCLGALEKHTPRGYPPRSEGAGICIPLSHQLLVGGYSWGRGRVLVLAHHLGGKMVLGAVFR